MRAVLPGLKTGWDMMELGEKGELFGMLRRRDLFDIISPFYVSYT